jgi:chemotaxis protein methyltransferase CheR
MNDADCVALLQWALPRLGLRWPGYRRVRGQACKRIDRRLRALGLSGPAAYKAYLDEHATEWALLETLCSIPISRFYRDRAVFDALGERILPQLAERAAVPMPPVVRCWSAGCASGEEAYTVSLVWDHGLGSRYAQTRLAIVATEIDTHLLERARVACYGRGSVRELPSAWVDGAFERRGALYCLREPYKARVEFRHQDIRLEQPAGEFDLVLCRNLAFTYFSEPVQREVLARIAERVRADGFLVIGTHESLPCGMHFVPSAAAPSIYRNSI